MSSGAHQFAFLVSPSFLCSLSSVNCFPPLLSWVLMGPTLCWAPTEPSINLVWFPTSDLGMLHALNAHRGGGRRGERGGSKKPLWFDLLKTHLKSKAMHITEGISWVLPTVMSNKVCCEVPTLPLCCDTESCQKILKSLHELGDGSCNYLSYCLAAAVLPVCCWPPVWLVLHLFALSLATDMHSLRWAHRRPSPLVSVGGEPCRDALAHRFWEKSDFSWPGPKAGFAAVSSTPRSLGPGDGAAASMHSQARAPNAAFCVCMCGFFPFRVGWE